MAYVIINNNRYDIPEMDFDAVCELEERGVNLIGMDKSNFKAATTIRGLVAFIMNTDVKTASREIEAHIAGGGNIVELFDGLTFALEKSGFFNQGGKKQPQDHQSKNGKIQQYQGNQQPQNRAQRRQNNRNRGNGNHSGR